MVNFNSSDLFDVDLPIEMEEIREVLERARAVIGRLGANPSSLEYFGGGRGGGRGFLRDSISERMNNEEVSNTPVYPRAYFRFPDGRLERARITEFSHDSGGWSYTLRPDDLEALEILGLDQGGNEREEQAQAERRTGKEMEAAEQRALNLLLSILTEEQKGAFEEHKAIPIRGNLGGEYVLFTNGISGNIYSGGGSPTREGPPVEGMRNYCAMPHNVYALPDPDVWLAQILLIEANEAEFLRRANIWEWSAGHWGGGWKLINRGD